MPRKHPKTRKEIKGQAPTPERRLRQGGTIQEAVIEPTTGRVLKRHMATAECVLDLYFRKGKLTAVQYKAALQFRKHYQRAILGIRTGDGAGSHGDPGMRPLLLLESERQLKTVMAVMSSAQQRIVINVCGHDEWVGDSYRFETFYRALARMAAHWNIGD